MLVRFISCTLQVLLFFFFLFFGGYLWQLGRLILSSDASPLYGSPMNSSIDVTIRVLTLASEMQSWKMDGAHFLRGIFLYACFVMLVCVLLPKALCCCVLSAANGVIGDRKRRGERKYRTSPSLELDDEVDD